MIKVFKISFRSLFLYINSPGGSVTSGLSVFDSMNYVQASVTTIGIGFAASMAVALGWFKDYKYNKNFGVNNGQ